MLWRLTAALPHTKEGKRSAAERFFETDILDYSEFCKTYQHFMGELYPFCALCNFVVFLYGTPCPFNKDTWQEVCCNAQLWASIRQLTMTSHLRHILLLGHPIPGPCWSCTYVQYIQCNGVSLGLRVPCGLCLRICL